MKAAINDEQRIAQRKCLDPIHVSDITSLDQFSTLARTGTIVDASSSGLLLHVDRKEFIPKVLRQNLNIDCIVGEYVKMEIQEMRLEIDGKVTRTRLAGQGVFEIAIEFSDSAPEYWRECLVDLLPDKGEFTLE